LDRLIKNEIKLNNVFHGRKLLEEILEIYKNDETLLATLQDDSAIDFTILGKIQAYRIADSSQLLK